MTIPPNQSCSLTAFRFRCHGAFQQRKLIEDLDQIDDSKWSRRYTAPKTNDWNPKAWDVWEVAFPFQKGWTSQLFEDVDWRLVNQWGSVHQKNKSSDKHWCLGPTNQWVRPWNYRDFRCKYMSRSVSDFTSNNATKKKRFCPSKLNNLGPKIVGPRCFSGSFNFIDGNLWGETPKRHIRIPLNQVVKRRWDDLVFRRGQPPKGLARFLGKLYYISS